MNGVGNERADTASQVLLPEPAPNRAQTLPGSILMRWLRGVIGRDRDGYVVIAGSGRTSIVLYGDGRPLAAAVTRGPHGKDVGDALAQIRADSNSDCFVMTYKLPPPVGTMLSGLFSAPSLEQLVTAPRQNLKGLLDDVITPMFTGAAVVWGEESIWAVLLIAGGEVFGCFSADDRSLKPSSDDVSALLYLDEIAISVHPPHEARDIEALLATPQARKAPVGRDAHIDHTESAMIALLSRLEHRISRIDPAHPDGAARLARDLIQTCAEAAEISGQDGILPRTQPPAHPLLAAHWDAAAGGLATSELLVALEMASIPDARLAASDALLLTLDLTVEQQLTWLAMADELSASTLREARGELLEGAQRLLRLWREQRRGPAGAIHAMPRGVRAGVLSK